MATQTRTTDFFCTAVRMGICSFFLCTDRTEGAVGYQSKFVVSEGMFEMSPESAYQLYTMHGFLNGESVPLVWALLPNKSSATYMELFTAARDTLVNYFGTTGCSWTFLVDFEAAAVKAIQFIFLGEWVSEWVSSFLTAHQHIKGHSVP